MLLYYLIGRYFSLDWVFEYWNPPGSLGSFCEVDAGFQINYVNTHGCHSLRAWYVSDILSCELQIN